MAVLTAECSADGSIRLRSSGEKNLLVPNLVTMTLNLV